MPLLDFARSDMIAEIRSDSNSQNQKQKNESR